MAEPATTRYTLTPDGVHIAYRTLGDGPLDILWFQGWFSNVEVVWDVPDLGPFLRRVAERGRVIVFDQRGWGVSDRPTSPDALSLDRGPVDALAVLDALGSERALMLGFEDGGISAILTAAAYPERVAGLLLFGTYAKGRRSDDYPFGWTEEEDAEFQREVERGWGTEEFWRYNLEEASPSTLREPEKVAAWARYSRLSASPGAALTLLRMTLDLDIRGVLPSVHVPTLVMHRSDDNAFEVGNGRYIAEHIPGARFVELAGNEHPPFRGDVEPVFGELDAFLDSVRSEQTDLQRSLATVLFTDIVGSTEVVADLGDRRWNELLATHHATVRAMLARFGGTEVDTAGDGFFATFDGPARALRCATATVEAVRALGIEIRAGVHTGEVETLDGKIAGMAVVVGARIGSLAGASEVLVSQTVKDLVLGSGLAFDDAGEHGLKGVPDRWRLYRVAGANPPTEPWGRSR